MNCSAGIYIHLPFCRQRCLYCDFYALTDFSQSDALISAIVDEIEDFDTPATWSVDTIYLGGGTPSALPPGSIEGLLQAVAKRFKIQSKAEITIEANPESVALERIRAYRQMGINRLNLGVQSFDDGLLKLLGRCHDVVQAHESLDLAVAAGFDNLGIDLIYGIPKQHPNDWRATLKTALSWPIVHLSAYALTYEPGTELTRAFRQGLLQPISDDEVALLYETAHRFLTQSGWQHYEISNFARNDAFRSQHNQKYWQHAPYYGFGPSAHSFDGCTRWWNPSNTAAYIDRIQHRKPARSGAEEIDRRTRLKEAIMLGLRCRTGINAELFSGTGPQTRARISKLQRRLESEGLLESGLHDLIRPTSQGMLKADALTRSFWDCLEGATQLLTTPAMFSR